jgi:hypothetical protein
MLNEVSIAGCKPGKAGKHGKKTGMKVVDAR